jgi:hypothetical protein
VSVTESNSRPKAKSCLLITGAAGLFILFMAGNFILRAAPMRCEGPYSPLGSPEAFAPPEADLSLVTGEPCEPPCWYGLMPGESTKDETLQTLETLTFVHRDSIRVLSTYASTPERELIEWDYRRGLITLDEEIVSTISVDLLYNLELGELVELMGEPTGYFVYTFPPPDNISIGPICVSAEAEFIWPEQGLTAEIRFDSRHPPRQTERVFNPSDTLYINSLTYSPPAATPLAFLIARGSVESSAENNLEWYYQPWEGFDQISMPKYFLD